MDEIADVLVSDAWVKPRTNDLVTVDLRPGQGKVTIGKIDVSNCIRDVVITAGVNEIPTVRMTFLSAHIVGQALGDCMLGIDEESAKVLEACGWTPPAAPGD